MTPTTSVFSTDCTTCDTLPASNHKGSKRTVNTSFG